MNLKELAESRVVMDADICGGRARIKGTRVTVSDIMLGLAEGMSHQEILRNFRSLQPKDIQAAIAYAFCVTDGVKLAISSSFGATKQLNAAKGEELLTKEEIDRSENDMFSKALEQQASIQEEITKEKVQQIKAKKIAKNKAPVVDTKLPPRERPYDLLIDISGEPNTKVFANEASIEQGINMDLDNYIFELRADGNAWLTYSTKEGVEIDQAMKRNLLVTYIGTDGNLKEAVFEGYLTTDRQHKVFIQKTNDGKVCGRAL
jgi:uncharacterized protein (DUF433 family)